MLKRFLCWLLGCVEVSKYAVGEAQECINQITGLPQVYHNYVIRKNDFCHRCGRDLRPR